MAAAAERMEIREVIGSAINARNLGADVTQQALRPVDRIAAFGMAGGHTLKRRLAESLWRVRWGQDARSRREAGELFAAVLHRRDEVQRRWNMRQPGGTLGAFALMVVLEWEHGRCSRCGGAGSIPRGAGRSADRSYCRPCNGTGRNRVHPGDRARAVGVTMSVHEKHWANRFEQAHRWLDEFEGSIEAPLRRKLRSG